MDTILKALKKAEDEAEEIEKEAKDKGANILKKAEAESRKLEAEAESKAKATGEGLVNVKMEEAKAEAEKIRDNGNKKAMESEEAAKGNFDKCVQEVVDMAILRMNEAGKGS